MKISLLVIISVLFPVFAWANDVAILDDSNLILPSDGLTYTIIKGSNTHGITINNSDFGFQVEGGSKVEMTSANKKIFKSSYSAPTACESDQSHITISFPSGTPNQGITITPSGSCAGSEGGGGSSGGGGGGGGSTSTPAPPPAQIAQVVPVPVVPQAAPVTPKSPTQTPAAVVSPIFNKDLRLGAKGDDVRRLQELLAKDKTIYPQGLITGYFGKATADAVVRFQKKYNFFPAGRVGPQTRKKIIELFGESTLPVSAPSPIPSPLPTPAPQPSIRKGITRTLSIGLRGDDVKIVQEYLAGDKTLYPEGIVNGSFGGLTKKAVGRFQEKYKIIKKGDSGYGMLGPKTRKKLNELMGQ